MATFELRKQALLRGLGAAMGLESSVEVASFTPPLSSQQPPCAPIHDVLEQPLLVEDLSPKGSLDLPILPLLKAINSLPSLLTTSSCSGRIALFSTPPKQGETYRGKGGEWLLVQHDYVSFEQVYQALTQALPRLQRGLVTFRSANSSLFDCLAS